MRVFRLLPALVALALSTTGCVQTAMLPADTLDDGETRASASATMWGVLFVPRLNGQVTQGFGEGDLTANLGAVLLPEQPVPGGGLAWRSYLTSTLSVEAQLQAAAFSDRAAGLALIGVQTIPPSEGGLYIGGQAGAIRGPSPDILFGDHFPPEGTRTWTAPLVGGTAGYGPIDIGPSSRLQIELKANLPVWGEDGEAPAAATGLSIGVFGLLE